MCRPAVQTVPWRKYRGRGSRGTADRSIMASAGTVHRKYVGIFNEAKLMEIIGELLEAS